MKFSLTSHVGPGKDIQSVEMLRGVASLMVCLFHIACGVPGYLPANSASYLAGRWGWTGVEIFFIISGFVIPYAMFSKRYTLADFPVFLKKRIIRIEPPYLISIVLVLLLDFISTLSPYYRGAPLHIDWPNVFAHVAYLNIFTGGTWLNPVFWSLAIEFQYYLLIALAFVWISSPVRAKRVAFYVLFGASAFVIGNHERFIFTFSGFFLTGILLFQLFCGIIDRKEFAVFLVPTLSLIGYRFGWVLMAISIATLLIILFVKKAPRPLLFLGTISYSLYLIHVPVGGRIVNISEVFIKSPGLRQLVAVFAVAVCLVAATLYYRIVEVYFKKAAGSIRYTQRKTEPQAAMDQPVAEQKVVEQQA